MSSRIGTFKTTWEGPRFAKMESFVRDLAFLNNLEIEVEIEKYIFRECGRIKVTGQEEDLYKFKREFEKAISDYNIDT